MDTRRILEIGGVVAGVVMIAFGVGSLALGVNARQTVGDELKKEFIVGSEDMNPADTETAVAEAGLTNVDIPSCDVAEKEIENGSDARCFAQYMRIHALESSDGNTYAQMGRLVSAAKDEEGEPISNGARNTWVTETALATALNVSYMAEQIALFSVVVGIALLLSGIGFIILAFAVLGGGRRKPTAA